MKKILTVLMMVFGLSAVFAYEPTYENAVYCESEVLPEKCASYSVVTTCLIEKVILVAPSFGKTTALDYIAGFYLHFDKFRDDYKTTLTKAVENNDSELYDSANFYMECAVEHIPFVTVNNFLTLTYKEMIDLYCDYALQMYR